MATINYTLRMDEADKKQAEQIFSKLGLTLAAGFNVYLKAVVRQQRIPFELALNAPANATAPSATAISAINDFLAEATALGDGSLTDADWAEMENLRSKTDLSRAVRL